MKEKSHTVCVCVCVCLFTSCWQEDQAVFSEPWYDFPDRKVSESAWAKAFGVVSEQATAFFFFFLFRLLQLACVRVVVAAGGVATFVSLA